MNLFSLLLLQPLANGLAITTQILGNNLGLGIVVFSLLLRIALTPLTTPYLKNMAKMKELAPQLAKLKKKHAKDKVKLAQAQAEFYKKKGVNPGSGCLPYLLQIIILIAFFSVFNRILVNNGNLVENFNSLLYDSVKFPMDVFINTNFLGIDLISPDTIKFGFLPFAVPGILVISSAVVQLLSSIISAPQIEVEQKQAKKTKNTEDDLQVAMQKSMVYTFPLFTLFIGMRFPAGLALYWLVFSAFQLVQQYKVTGGNLASWPKKLNLLQSGLKNGNKKN